jgi:DNA-binding NtrC family response regulator
MDDAQKIFILLMDAEKNSCEEMQEFLQKEGFTVFSAHSGKEGQRVLDHRNIDILFLDTCLPDADGLELLKDYKVRYPQLEVILISGHGDMNYVIQAMRLKALDFLRKPMRQMELMSAIERSEIIKSRSDSSRDNKNTLPRLHLAL